MKAEQKTFVVANHVLSPMASGTAAHVDAMLLGETGVRFSHRQEYHGQGVCASLFSAEDWKEMHTRFPGDWSPFELLLLGSLTEVLKQVQVDLSDPRTLLLVASTKGNIGLLEPSTTDPGAVGSLSASALKVGRHFGYHAEPIVVSNACISGMTALLVAKRLMDSGLYDQAVVTGADCISPFIIAGFRSFQALSDEPCRPFDLNRKGINLGEASASMVLAKVPVDALHPAGIPGLVYLAAGSTSNDANHISGPSRTGEEMAQAITAAMENAGLEPRDIGFIAAHGTATPYNDEMESKAFTQAALQNVPAFSLKAYFGHTLGAAGLLESAISVEALKRGLVLASRGYEEHGVSMPVTIAKENYQKPGMRHFLKTGSGFGGCNAALIFSKNN